MRGRYGERGHHGGSMQRRVLATGVVALLLLPMVAMRFTDMVDWTAYDFAAAALLLGGGAIAYDMATRRTRKGKSRVITGVAVILLVALVWAQGAGRDFLTRATQMAPRSKGRSHQRHWPYSIKMTGTSLPIICATRAASQLLRRTQPWLCDRPIRAGSGVP